MSVSSLKDKALLGVSWSAADTFFAKGVSFVVGLVLARILSPEEYGLIGIVLIFVTILEGFVDCGFANALIRKKEVVNDDYNTLFFSNITISVVMFIILFVGAPLISQFFNRPQLVPLVRVMGVLIILQALSIVQNTILTRQIDFKTKAKVSVFSALVSGVIGISAAFAGFGVWSLVCQQISRQLLYSLLLWVNNRWWPQLSFSIVSFKYMWGYGWKLMVSGFLDRVWNQLYQVVVGKYYNPATLGQYSRAKEYAAIFSSNITSIVQRVSLPVLSQIQDKTDRMVAAYRKIIKITMFITAICMISLAAISKPLIYCLIGPKWLEAASYMPLICISMSLWPLHAINLNMLQVQGRSDLYLILELIKKVIAIVPIVLGIFISIYWMLLGTIIVGIISFFLNSYYTGRNLGYSSWSQIKDIAPSFGIAFLVACSVYFLKYLPISYWIILPLQIIIGVTVFFFIAEKSNLEEYNEVKRIIINYFAKDKS